MLRSYDATVYKECQVPNTGEKASCLIPLMPGLLFDLNVQCEKEVQVSMVTEDGQTIPMQTGKILKMRGVNRNFQALEILADTNFFYRALLGRTDEEVDPVPAQVELVTKSTDAIRAMIDERLRAWQVKQEMDRPLTDDEKDELVLDLIHGDLEFEDTPDEFGLGYEERLAEFVQRTAEQSSTEAAEPADSVPNSQDSSPPAGPAAGSNSSST